MVALPKSESVESPNTPYVGELREFFDMHGLHFGTPEDIVPFAEKLGRAGTFSDDMRSMIRSIIFRERGAISRAGLLGIVTTAIGGPNVDDNSHDVAAPVQTILAFLGEVTRAQWGMSGTEADESPEDVSESIEAAPQIAVPDTALAVESEAVAVEMETYASAYRYSYTRAMYPEPILQGGNLREFPMPLATTPFDPEPISGSVPPVVARRQNTVLSAWMKAPWISVAAICLILVAGLMVVKFGRSSESSAGGVSEATLPVVTPYPPSAPVAAAVRAPHVATTASKPTAYGQPVRQVNSRKVGANTASVGPVVHDAYSGATTTAPVAAAGTASAQPPAPIYRVSPIADGSLAAQPTRATAASNSWRPPRATASDWLAVPPGVMARNLISGPAPKYPRLASFVHVKGKVILRAVVSRNGTVLTTEVLRGPHLLRGAAKDAVGQWRFRPYVLNGRPTEVATVVTVDFDQKR